MELPREGSHTIEGLADILADIEAAADRKESLFQVLEYFEGLEEYLDNTVHNESHRRAMLDYRE